MLPIRLALIEDDPEMRELLHGYLCSQPEFECVAAPSVERFLADLPGLLPPPQLLLLDAQRPGLSSLDALPLLRKLLPSANIVLQALFDDPDLIYQALCRGASGCLHKNTPLAELKATVLEVARGGASMSRAVARKVLAHFEPRSAAPPVGLAPGERAVVQGIVEGLGNEQVAARLGTSPELVSSYIKGIYKKLEASTSTELVN
jgi:DNA-binding NarL/FixJ family response regulator